MSYRCLIATSNQDYIWEVVDGTGVSPWPVGWTANQSGFSHLQGPPSIQHAQLVVNLPTGANDVGDTAKTAPTVDYRQCCWQPVPCHRNNKVGKHCGVTGVTSVCECIHFTSGTLNVYMVFNVLCPLSYVGLMACSTSSCRIRCVFMFERDFSRKANVLLYRVCGSCPASLAGLYLAVNVCL